MQYTTFGNMDLKVSKLGLGGAPLGGVYEETDKAEIQRMIHEAIDLGINIIDTAPIYADGESERRIGQALTGGKREHIILTTKAVRSDRSYDYASTINSVEDSLVRLQTDWIDLLQIHDIEVQAWDMIMEETIPALQKLKQAGKFRYLGASSRNLPLLMKYMKTGLFDCIQFYTRYMLIDHTAKEEILPLAKEMGIGVINGSVLGMGVLADAPGHFLKDEVVIEAKRRVDMLDFLRKSEPKGLIEPAMRFSLSHPDIQVTLTGISTVNALRMNVAFCDGVGLPEQELQEVYRLFDQQKLLTDPDYTK
ncbi:aldo/keto reductase [Paenibacillus psychroresistens]|uniref:Aldo/keto reductase n=1 Tax=Paenibacillus psychroresistens TaxID=1778678 RepID=A0A6B8RG60_9BACL|nr:aldo/keto reductase [Paenibacillus psychroresistens]QGQ94565.1 aldo/keto reductase [Paenibacillus psychroresistens]